MMAKMAKGETEPIDPEVYGKFKKILRKSGALAEDGEFGKAIELLESNLKEAEKLKFIQPEVELRNNLGILHWKNNSFPNFLEITATALALARAHNYKRGVAEALLNLAWVLAMERKDFIKAFDFTEEALEVTEEIGYAKGIATSLYIISTAYKHKKMKEKANYYLEKSLEISMSLAEETDLLIPSEEGLTEEEKAQLKGALDLL
ncbi:MAG: tetratricopeptide repeat protein [Candidatus Hermodarchaeota archaeon]